jgi:outer membrane protein TolC
MSLNFLLPEQNLAIRTGLLLSIVSLAACTQTSSPFHVGELPEIHATANLEDLHQKHPKVPLVTRPEIRDNANIQANTLYEPRPELAPAQPTVIAPTTSSGSKPDRYDGTKIPLLELSLPETILLGLRKNKQIESAYIGRVAEKYSLYVAEEEFVPRWKAITASTGMEEGDSDSDAQTSRLGTHVTWDTPYGTSFAFSWDNEHLNSSGSAIENSGSSKLELTLTQPLLRGAGFDINTATLRTARIEEERNRLALRSSVMNTISVLSASYFDYVKQERSVEIALKDLGRSKKLLQANMLQVQAGELAAAEVVQTRFAVSNKEMALHDSNNSLDNARLRLLNLLSLELKTPIQSAQQLDPNLLPVDLDRAVQIASENNPNYLSQRLSINIAEINLQTALDDLRWKLDLKAGYSKSGTSNNVSGAISDLPDAPGLWNASLNLEIPIDRLDLTSNQVGAEVALEQANLNLENSRENLETAVRNAVRNVGSTWQRVLLSKRSRELARQTLKIEIMKLKAGRTTNFEVIARQESLQQAESSELNTVIAYLLALIQLDQQLGTTLKTWKIDL